jgi:hypothetical protein
MKIKAEIDLNVLSNYLFVEVSELDEYYNPFDCQLDFLGFADYTWLYEIGHSRRGQCYYLLVTNERELVVVASKPDGSGGTVSSPSILKQMILDGLVE